FVFVILPMAILFLCCFFFSSRRRHTRCLSDWSSDVCSSDLFHGPIPEQHVCNDGPQNQSHPVLPVEVQPKTRKYKNIKERVGNRCRKDGPRAQSKPAENKTQYEAGEHSRSKPQHDANICRSKI